MRQLSLLRDAYAICTFPTGSDVPGWLRFDSDFVSIVFTPSELSIICPSEMIPESIRTDDPWFCFRIDGSGDLDEPGVLAAVVEPLARDHQSVFAVASYETDHILVRDPARAAQVLRAAGHTVM
jgi:hypothetical protein